MANYTILLIDYEPRSIERTRGPLMAAGYTVHVATDGLSGSAAFSQLQPELVLIEAMIPKKHGFEVCQDLKKTPQGRRTPIVIMTSVYKGRKYRSQALHLYQCDEYIEKPIPDDQLLAVVRRFIGEAPAPAPGLNPPAPALSMSGQQDEMDFVAALSEDDESGIEIEIVDPDAESAEPEPPPRAPQPAGPRKILSASDAAELEIMERLDAIIPGGSGPKSPSFPKASFGVAATATARQLHDPIHGDFAAPATDDAVAGDEIPSPAEQAEKQDLHHVVPFDRAKRSRKGKRGRGAKAVSAAPPPPAADAVPLSVGGEHSSEIPYDGARDERSAPAAWSAQHGTPADLPEREPLTSGAPTGWSRAMPPAYQHETPEEGTPRWVWLVAALGIALAVYVLVLR